MKDRIFTKNLNQHIDQEISVLGWIDVRRDQGKMIFLDLRDVTGKVQCVILPNQKEALEKASEVRNEWVVKIVGKVNKRPEKMVKDGVVNGDIEIEVFDLEVLNQAQTPHFPIDTDGHDIGEDNRLKYRYLDLKRFRLQNNIKARHKAIKFLRDKLDEENFLEIETPILTKSTPEGARDYIVPSRLDRGKFYALPQSPQQYKQLLMASGFERYFQFAKCMRDEDTRGDRQPEFTQLDIEASFVSQEDVMDLNEKLLIELIEKLYPNKKIQEVPFPRLTHKEAMEKYGSDRPDLREDKDDPNLLAFVWITDFPFFEKDEETSKLTFSHNPFSIPKEDDIEKLLKKEDLENIISTQYDIALNGFEIGGGSLRSHRSDILKTVLSVLGYNEEEIKDSFGHMLDALSSGTPPHGGIAWGFDRLMMILQNEPNIREVMAFPKTGEGRDLMMRSPSEVDQASLDELGLSVKKKDQ